jgi:NADPH:quinone reductase-like Zn-dependent oxidoreductase
MRAITVSEYGASPALTDLPMPQPEAGQVLIAIRAAGVNPMDMQIANGGWKDRMPARFPMVLGADLAGAVREDGPGADRFAPADEVFGHLVIPRWDRRGHTPSTWQSARTRRWRTCRPAWTW